MSMNWKQQANAYHSLIFGKGRSTSSLSLSTEEAKSFLLHNEQMLERFHNHGFTPMEHPFFDPAYDLNKKVTCKGILIHTFFVKAKEADDGEGNSIIRPLKSPCDRHFLKYANSTYLNKVPNHVPFTSKFKSGEMHETLIPAEYVFMPFDMNGNINPDLISIYRSTKPGTEQALHWNQVSIKYGLSANSHNAKNAFFGDNNIKNAVSRNLINGEALFEVHSVSLVYHGYADHNRMTDDKTKKWIYPKPDIKTGYGYVHYFIASAAMMGIKLYQREFHEHAGSSNVLERGQKELRESNIKISEQDEKEVKKLFDSYEQKYEAGHSENSEEEVSNTVQEEVSNTVQEEQSSFVEEASEDFTLLEIPEEVEMSRELKKGYVQNVIGSKFYKKLEGFNLDSNEFFAFLLCLVQHVLDTHMYTSQACKVLTEGIDDSINLDINRAMLEIIDKVKSGEISKKQITDFTGQYNSSEDVKSLLGNLNTKDATSFEEFDLDDLEEEEEENEEEETTSNTGSEYQASAPTPPESEPQVEIDLDKREFLLESIKDLLGLQFLEEVEPSLENLDCIVKCIHTWMHKAGMETSFSFDEISKVKDLKSFKGSGITIIGDLEEKETQKLEPFYEGINSFEELKAYVDDSNSSSSEESSNEPDESEIEQASDDPEMSEWLQQLNAEAEEEEQQEKEEQGSNKDHFDVNQLDDPSDFFS